MEHAWLLFSVLYGLPFILAFIHLRCRQTSVSSVVYYRYFILFNMIFMAIFVSARLLLSAEQATQISGWFYGSMMVQYGFALLSMAVLGVCTVFANGTIKYAPAVCWAVFLLLSAGLRVYELYHHRVLSSSMMNLHLYGDLLIALTIVILAARGKRSERNQRFNYVV